MCLFFWLFGVFLRKFLIKYNDNYCDKETLLLKRGLFSLFLSFSLFPLGCTLTGKSTFWSKLPHSPYLWDAPGFALLAGGRKSL